MCTDISNSKLLGTISRQTDCNDIEFETYIDSVDQNRLELVVEHNPRKTSLLKVVDQALYSAE